MVSHRKCAEAEFVSLLFVTEATLLDCKKSLMSCSLVLPLVDNRELWLQEKHSSNWNREND